MWWRLALLCVLPGLAAAQATPSPARAGVAGIATRDSTHPLEGVEVTLVEAHRSVLSDVSGSFRIMDVAPGSYTLVARKLGYESVRVTMTLDPGRIVMADLELAPSVQRLGGVVVREDSSRTAFRNALDLRHSLGGQLFLRATLDSARGTTVADLVARRGHGAHLVRYGRTGASLLASTRGNTSIDRPLPRADQSDPTSPQGCYLQVYVDGAKLYGSGDFAVPDLGQYDAASLEAVEFFPGPATTPSEFGGTSAMCGTIAIWTKAH